jgi:hypothetical protein
MELLNCEQKARSVGGCAAFLFALFLCGCFSLPIAGILVRGWGWLAAIVFGPFAAFLLFLLFLCVTFIYGLIKNEAWRLGIRDDIIWWESPRWPRSEGFLPLRDVCKVTINDNEGKLEVTTRDGTTLRTRCCSWGPKLRAILRDHYQGGCEVLASPLVNVLDGHHGECPSDGFVGRRLEQGPEASQQPGEASLGGPIPGTNSADKFRQIGTNSGDT